MQVNLLKSKLHHARVTDASKEYPGSLGVSRELMAAVGLLPYERILCGNVENGERFETYAIPLDAPGQIVLNGATAHLGQRGDRLIIMAFTWLDAAAAVDYRPRVVVLDVQNVVQPSQLAP